MLSDIVVEALKRYKILAEIGRYGGLVRDCRLATRALQEYE